MNTYSAKVGSFELVKSLFDTLDEHHRKQLFEKIEYRDKSNREYIAYLEKCNMKIYQYDYDPGVHYELAFEAHAAEAEFQYYNEIKELQLLALYEMKALYLYKEIEIRLKTLIFSKYQQRTEKLSNLSTLTDFFLEKNVDIKIVNGYEEIDNLRRVANDLKHSLEINTSKGIPEFIGKLTFNAQSLHDFMQNKLYVAEVFFERLILKINNEPEPPFIKHEDGIPF